MRRRPPGLSQDVLAGADRALARGERRVAAREYRMAVVLFPKEPALLLRVARGLMQLGDLDGAAAALDRAKPLAGRGLVLRGHILRQKGQSQAALDVFARALSTDPNDPEAAAGLGDVLLDQDRYTEAIRYLTLSLERRPSGSVHNSLGIAHAMSGQLERAVEHFHEAAELDPGIPVAANLARARAALAQRARP